MKKIILLTLIALCTTTAFAQTKAWKIALHVDPNVSWLKPDNNDITAGGTKLNFGYGISIDKMFTDNYAFGTGLQIFNAGGKLSYLSQEIATEKVNTTKTYNSVAEKSRVYKLKYLEVPLTLRLRTNEIGYITYWVQVGVGLGFNIKARSNDEIDHKIINTGTEDSPVWSEAGDVVIDNVGSEAFENVDINKEVRLFRTSLIAGGGIEYNLSGDVSLVSGIIFNNAFSNVLRGDGVALSNGEPSIKENFKPQTFDLKAISNALSLQVGILF